MASHPPSDGWIGASLRRKEDARFLLGHDELGRPLATAFGDYMVPCAPEIPDVRLAHLMSPARVTEYGVKGLGEGGAIAPPAAIANAVADALRTSAHASTKRR